MNYERNNEKGRNIEGMSWNRDAGQTTYMGSVS